MTAAPPPPPEGEQPPSYPTQPPVPPGTPGQPDPYGAYPAAYPTAPGGSPMGRPPAPTQPATIAQAVRLMRIGGILAILDLVVSLTMIGSLKDDIRDALRDAGQSASTSAVDAAYAVAIVSILIFGALGAALWFWMAWKNGEGRGWARIVATVFAVINLIGTLASLGAAGTSPISTLLGAAGLVVGLGALVLLYRPDSKRFYIDSAAARQMY